MSLLLDILRSKRSELKALRAQKLPSPPALRPVLLRGENGNRFHLICEFKRRSPSAGELSGTLSLEERVKAYADGGASMVSVLCDSAYFGGSYADLAAAYRSAEVPLLAKEFIIDEAQLDAARAFGASSALLIVRCLTPDELARLHAAALERELLPIVEVTSPDEVRIALEIGATHIGVNARDLDTLAMDAGRAEHVLSLLPEDRVRLHFSGVRDAAQITELRRARLDGALIGESLMRQDNPRELLRTFVESAQTRLT